MFGRGRPNGRLSASTVKGVVWLTGGEYNVHMWCGQLTPIVCVDQDFKVVGAE